MKMSRLEAFEIIGVPQDASEGEIKAAYRKLALATHPDKNEGSAESTTKFKQINAAYNRLQANDDETSDDEDYGMNDDDIIPFNELVDFLFLHLFMRRGGVEKHDGPGVYNNSFPSNFHMHGFGGPAFGSSPFGFGESRMNEEFFETGSDSEDEDDSWLYRRRERMKEDERQRMELNAKKRAEEEAEVRKRQAEEEVMRKEEAQARHAVLEAEKRRKKQEKARNKERQVFGGTAEGGYKEAGLVCELHENGKIHVEAAVTSTDSSSMEKDHVATVVNGNSTATDIGAGIDWMQASTSSDHNNGADFSFSRTTGVGSFEGLNNGEEARNCRTELAAQGSSLASEKEMSSSHTYGLSRTERADSGFGETIDSPILAAEKARKSKEKKDRQRERKNKQMKEKAARRMESENVPFPASFNNPFAALERDEGTTRVRVHGPRKTGDKAKAGEQSSSFVARAMDEIQPESGGGPRTRIDVRKVSISATSSTRSFEGQGPFDGGGHGSSMTGNKWQGTAEVQSNEFKSKRPKDWEKRLQEVLDEELAMKLQAEEERLANQNLRRAPSSRVERAGVVSKPFQVSSTFPPNQLNSGFTLVSLAHPLSKVDIGMDSEKHSASFVQANVHVHAVSPTEEFVTASLPPRYEKRGSPSTSFQEYALPSHEEAQSRGKGVNGAAFQPQAAMSSNGISVREDTDWCLEMQRLEAGLLLDQQRQQQVVEQRKRKEELVKVEDERRKRAEEKLMEKTSSKARGPGAKKRDKLKEKQKEEEREKEVSVEEQLSAQSWGFSANGFQSSSRSMSMSSSEAGSLAGEKEKASTAPQSNRSLDEPSSSSHQSISYDAGLHFRMAGSPADITSSMVETMVETTRQSLEVGNHVTHVQGNSVQLSNETTGHTLGQVNRGSSSGHVINTEMVIDRQVNTGLGRGELGRASGAIDEKHMKQVNNSGVHERLLRTPVAGMSHPSEVPSDQFSKSGDVLQQHSGTDAKPLAKRNDDQKGELDTSSKGQAAGKWMLAEDLERELYSQADQEPPIKEETQPWDVATILLGMQKKTVQDPIVFKASSDASRTSPTSPLEAASTFSDLNSRPVNPEARISQPSRLIPMSTSNPVPPVKTSQYHTETSRTGSSTDAVKSHLPYRPVLNPSHGVRAPPQTGMPFQLSASGQAFVPSANRPPASLPISGHSLIASQGDSVKPYGQKEESGVGHHMTVASTIASVQSTSPVNQQNVVSSTTSSVQSTFAVNQQCVISSTTAPVQSTSPVNQQYVVSTTASSVQSTNSVQLPPGAQSQTPSVPLVKSVSEFLRQALPRIQPPSDGDHNTNSGSGKGDSQGSTVSVEAVPSTGNMLKPETSIPSSGETHVASPWPSGIPHHYPDQVLYSQPPGGPQFFPGMAPDGSTIPYAFHSQPYYVGYSAQPTYLMPPPPNPYHPYPGQYQDIVPYNVPYQTGPPQFYQLLGNYPVPFGPPVRLPNAPLPPPPRIPHEAVHVRFGQIPVEPPSVNVSEQPIPSSIEMKPVAFPEPQDEVERRASPPQVFTAGQSLPGQLGPEHTTVSREDERGNFQYATIPLENGTLNSQHLHQQEFRSGETVQPVNLDNGRVFDHENLSVASNLNTEIVGNKAENSFILEEEHGNSAKDNTGEEVWPRNYQDEESSSVSGEGETFDGHNCEFSEESGFGREEERGFGREEERGFGREGERGIEREEERGSGREGERGFGREEERGFGSEGEREFGREDVGEEFGRGEVYEESRTGEGDQGGESSSGFKNETCGLSPIGGLATGVKQSRGWHGHNNRTDIRQQGGKPPRFYQRGGKGGPSVSDHGSVCVFFQKGLCRFGDKCMNVHVSTVSQNPRGSRTPFFKSHPQKSMSSFHNDTLHNDTFHNDPQHYKTSSSNDFPETRTLSAIDNRFQTSQQSQLQETVSVSENRRSQTDPQRSRVTAVERHTNSRGPTERMGRGGGWRGGGRGSGSPHLRGGGVTSRVKATLPSETV